jgi:hypothetical protein
MRAPPGGRRSRQQLAPAMALLALLLTAHATHWTGAQAATASTAPAVSAAAEEWPTLLARGQARRLAQTCSTPAATYLDCDGSSLTSLQTSGQCTAQTSFRECSAASGSTNTIRDAGVSRIVCFPANSACSAPRLQVSASTITQGVNPAGDPCTGATAINACVLQWTSAGFQEVGSTDCTFNNKIVRNCYTAETITGVTSQSNCWRISSTCTWDTGNQGRYTRISLG